MLISVLSLILLFPILTLLKYCSIIMNSQIKKKKLSSTKQRQKSHTNANKSQLYQYIVAFSRKTAIGSKNKGYSTYQLNRWKGSQFGRERTSSRRKSDVTSHTHTCHTISHWGTHDRYIQCAYIYTQGHNKHTHTHTLNSNITDTKDPLCERSSRYAVCYPSHPPLEKRIVA